MALGAEHQHYLESLADLRREDHEFRAGLEPQFHNHTESRNPHYQPGAQWAGEKQSEFGAHRRGPNSRDW